MAKREIDSISETNMEVVLTLCNVAGTKVELGDSFFVLKKFAGKVGDKMILSLI